MTPIKQALEALKTISAIEKSSGGVARPDGALMYVTLHACREATAAYEALSKYQEWVLVPREPTVRQSDLGKEAAAHFGGMAVEAVYHAMISAAAKQHMEGE